MGNSVAMECLGAIDQGTQSSRFILYDSGMNTISSSSVPVEQIYPHPGWVEQMPAAIWATVEECVNQAVTKAIEKVGDLKVRAIGIANQRETTVVWDRESGEALCHAIVWNDDRTSGLCSQVASERGIDAFREATGLPISTYFSMFKLIWMLENIPEVSRAAKEGRCMFGTIDSWLMFKLTNGTKHCIDVTNASRTGLMNLKSLTWDKSIVSDMGLDCVILPEIISNAEVVGQVSAIPALAGTPIAGCLGDQQASMLGHRLKKNQLKNTYGTGCFVLLNTGEDIVQSTHGLLTTVAFKLGRDEKPMFALEGSIGSAGQGISWLRDSLEILASSSESERVASDALDCDGVIFVPAFSGLLAPWWSSAAKASILGMTYATKKSHIVRAMLAAICFQTRDVLEVMKLDSGIEDIDHIAVDGGASNNDVLMQMQADVLGIPIQRAESSEATALGAALAAGIGAKLWTVSEALGSDGSNEATIKAKQLFTPLIPQENVISHYEAWKKAVAATISVSESLNAHPSAV